MNALPSRSGSGDDAIFDTIAAAIADDGYVVLPDALPQTMLDGLFTHFTALDREEFKTAGIGREDDHQLNRFVRSDEILWLSGEHPASASFLDWIEHLRLHLNRRLFLGLFDYESHYARYAAGGFYKKHVDAFKGERNRVLTTVLYLNPDWSQSDGGELVMYTPESDEVLQTVMPRYGTLVVFLSEDFPHEVLPAGRSRYSIAGWFRVNNSGGNAIDPPR